MHEKSIDHLSLPQARRSQCLIDWKKQQQKKKKKNTRTKSKAKYEASRSIKNEATQNDNNTGNALQRSVA